MTLHQHPEPLSLPRPALTFDEGAATQRGGIICPDGGMSMMSLKKEIKGLVSGNFFLSSFPFFTSFSLF